MNPQNVVKWTLTSIFLPINSMYSYQFVPRISLQEMVFSVALNVINIAYILNNANVIWRLAGQEEETGDRTNKT